MTTLWTKPKTINQFAETGGEQAHLSWKNLNNLINPSNGITKTLGHLFHIARSPKHDLTNKTFYIFASNFQFQNLPNTISGIEVNLLCDREGRATDDTVQLYLNNKFIGENRANLDIKNEKIYGGNTDLWNVKNLTIETLQNSNFGVVVRFKSHPHWPHRSSVTLYAVEMRIH